MWQESKHSIIIESEFLDLELPLRRNLVCFPIIINRIVLYRQNIRLVAIGVPFLRFWMSG